ncbi:MAG: ATP-binding cassette domain-containing protein [bacterium]
MPIIQVKNLSKQFKIRANKNIITGLFNPKYKFVDAVSDISFQVEKGEALAFLGPNGAGKTTTIKMLTGLIYPTEGKISILGFRPFERKREYLKQIGLVMGNKTGLNWDLTARQSFWLFKKIYEIKEKRYQSRLKELCGILDVERLLDTQVRKLSLGERMKMELIGAILHDPKLLFLDEPTIGLDITSKKNIRNFLKDLQKNSGISFILTSHDMDDIETVCERVIVINKGKKIYDNYLEKLMQQHNQEKFVKFYFDEEPGEFSWIDYAKIDKRTKDSVIFKTEKALMPRLISEITSKYTNIIDIDMISTPLEDIIEGLFKK